jgi:uncharacterized protein YdbL (DUF1318 family)
MKVLSRLGVSFFLVTIMTLTACVTINVYFPASQAERAAERIVDEILGEPVNKPAESTDKGAFIITREPGYLVASVSRLLISDAQAAAPDFSVNTPEIRRLQAGMTQRHGKLEAFYNSGAIGFDASGLVSWRDQNAVSIKERGALNGLLKAENSDRNSLYRAIADANGHPEWEKDVRSVFAKKWIEKAKSGWWYQQANGSWKQK